MAYRWRHIVVFEDRVVIWRGDAAIGRRYELTRERAHRLGRLLDGCAEVTRLSTSALVYSWDDWDWTQIAGGR